MDFEKYDKLCFNPLRFECTNSNVLNHSNDDNHARDVYTFPKSPYPTPEQLKMRLLGA